MEIRIVEIEPLANGGHRNQTGNFKTIPKGYAVIPNDIETPNFPFGTVTAKEIAGVMTVTNWEAGEIPEPQESEPPVSELERLRADVDYIAVMTGVVL